ncbi:MAG: hypothetical protein AAGD00_08610 [Planctomycetota bacterium]
MKTSTPHIVLAPLFLAASGVANAGMTEETFNCGPAFFDPHTPFFIDDDQRRSRQRFPTQNPNPIVGLRIDIEYIERDEFGGPAPDPTGWASDLGVILDFDGVRYGFGGSRGNLGELAGGYSLGEAIGVVDFYDTWDFDGPVSNEPGFYTHEFDLPFPIGKAAELRVFLTDTWNGNTEYRTLNVTTIKVPTPGAVATLGLAGIAATRRHRKD